MKRPKKLYLQSFRYGLFAASCMLLDEIMIHSTYYETGYTTDENDKKIEIDTFKHIKKELELLEESAIKNKEDNYWVIKDLKKPNAKTN